MNTELRSYVLQKSLLIEDDLNKILRAYFEIDKSDSKTLSHKSSSLSFQTKADLLYDMGKIAKEDYTYLKMFMEIRNQFIHSIDAYSFEIVLERTGNRSKLLDLEPNLRKYINEENREETYGIAFKALIVKIFSILSELSNNVLEHYKKKIEHVTAAKNEVFYLILVKAFDNTVSEFFKRIADTLRQEGLDESTYSQSFEKIFKESFMLSLKNKLGEEFPEFLIPNSELESSNG